jgi:hypothetical protein
MTCGEGLFHDPSFVEAHRRGTVAARVLDYSHFRLLPWGDGSGAGLRRQGRTGEDLVCVRR